jgi:outer membrane protein OmpA-like peptidoglycan-associated protein
MSILNGIKGLIGNELVSGLASQLGESNDGINKAMGGIVPSLLGGLMNSKQEDHGMLSGLLSQAGNLGGGNLVGDLLGGLTGGSSNAGIGGIGGSLVSGLLGDKAGGVINMISSLAGIKSSSSSSLMSIGGSLLASFLGKKLLGGAGGGITGIISSLMGEKKEIAAALPSGASSLLGLGNIFGSVQDAVGNAAGAVSGAAGAAGAAAKGVLGGDDDNKGGGMKWLWPILLAGLIGLGIWYMMGKGCNKGAEGDAAATAEQTTTTGDATATGDAGATAGTDAAATATTTATDAAGTASASPAPAAAATVAPAARTSTKIKLSNGVEINAYEGGVESKLVAFLSDPSSKVDMVDKTKNWFDFDNLNFDLGKSTITKESQVQLDNLAAILKAYPSMKIKVGGYTDKKGDDAANMKLSQSRANAVDAALKSRGITGGQVEKAEGYGETLAVVAETASDEERRKDRRTAVRVLAK